MSELAIPPQRRIGDRSRNETHALEGWGFQFENLAISLRLISTAPDHPFSVRTEDIDKPITQSDVIIQADSPTSPSVLVDFLFKAPTWGQLLQYMCNDGVQILGPGEDDRSYIKLVDGLGKYGEDGLPQIIREAAKQSGHGEGFRMQRKAV